EVRVGVGHERRDLVEPIELGLDRDAVLDVLQHRLRLIELGFLHEDADRETGSQLGLAVGRRVQTGHDLEDRRLTGAVRADHADLRPGQERHGDVVEDELVAHRPAASHHGVDVFSHEAALLLSAGMRNRLPWSRLTSLPAFAVGLGRRRPRRRHAVVAGVATVTVTSRWVWWPRSGTGPRRAAA